MRAGPAWALLGRTICTCLGYHACRTASANHTANRASSSRSRLCTNPTPCHEDRRSEHGKHARSLPCPTAAPPCPPRIMPGCRPARPTAPCTCPPAHTCALEGARLRAGVDLVADVHRERVRQVRQQRVQHLRRGGHDALPPAARPSVRPCIGLGPTLALCSGCMTVHTAARMPSVAPWAMMRCRLLRPPASGQEDRPAARLFKQRHPHRGASPSSRDPAPRCLSCTTSLPPRKCNSTLTVSLRAPSSRLRALPRCRGGQAGPKSSLPP